MIDADSNRSMRRKFRFGASVFSTAAFLELSGEEPFVEEFAVGKKHTGRIVAVRNNGILAKGTFQVYGGLSFSQDLESEFFASAKFQQDLAESLAPFVLSFESVQIGLDPTIVDVRGLTWLDFEDPRIQSRLTPRYTSIIRLQNLESTLMKSRLADCQRGRNNGLLFSEVDRATFSEVYRSFHQKQKLSEASLLPALSIIHGDSESIEIRRFQVHLDGEPVACALFMVDHPTAYLLLLARSVEISVGGASSLLLAESLAELRKDCGIEFIDLVGVNSPQRGSFKESFGGDLSLYFDWTAQIN